MRKSIREMGLRAWLLMLLALIVAACSPGGEEDRQIIREAAAWLFRNQPHRYLEGGKKC